MHECLVSFKAIHHHHSVRKSVKKSQKSKNRCTFLEERAHALPSARFIERTLYRAHALSSARFTALPSVRFTKRTLYRVAKIQIRQFH